MPLLGLLLGIASALALYAGSGHARVAWLARWQRAGSAAGLMLAGASLVAWCLALGIGAGLCAMLGGWMLAMIAVPYAASLPEATR